MLRYLLFGCFRGSKIVVVYKHCPCRRYIERDAFTLIYDLYKRLSNSVPNSQLVKDIWISFSQVCDHKCVVDNTLDNLTCDDSWFGNLIGTSRFISFGLDSRADDVMQYLVGPFTSVRFWLANRRNHKARLHAVISHD